MEQFAVRVEQHVQEIHERLRLAVDRDIGRTHVLAAFVCGETDDSNLYVASYGTGTNWIAHENLAMDGRTVFDSHAEVIARRGFKRYLYHELKKYTISPEDSIFCRSDVTEGKLTLKDQHKIHLYINTTPCGCASYNFSRFARRNGKAELTARKERSSGYFITDPHTSEEHLRWDYVTHQGELKLKTMTCSDKICQWNVVGVQGALLSHFLDPIYLTSIVIGSNFKKDQVQLALNRRLESLTSENYSLPPPFRVNCPIITGREEKQIIHGNRISLNWFAGKGVQVEINNGFRGRVLHLETCSRLCKMELFTAFVEVCRLGFFNWTRLLQDNTTYLEFKEGASSYKEAKTALTNYLRRSGLGHWISRPREVDVFSVGPKKNKKCKNNIL